MNLPVINKILITEPLKNQLTEGEKLSTQIMITIPSAIDGMDLSDYTFFLNASIEDSLCSVELFKTVSDNIELSGALTEEFTYRSGTMTFALMGENADKSSVIIFSGSTGVEIKKKPSGYTPTEKNQIQYTNVGDIKLSACETAPEGWKICNGEALSRTVYKELFNAVGTVYGEGDGLTTFNIPDLCGRVAVGKGEDTEFASLGASGGEKAHSLTADENGPHSHSIQTFKDTDGSYLSYENADIACSFINTETASSGLGTAHNNLQPYITLNYLIFTGVKND